MGEPENAVGLLHTVVAACQDLDLLDRWIARAATANSVDEIVRE